MRANKQHVIKLVADLLSDHEIKLIEFSEYFFKNNIKNEKYLPTYVRKLVKSVRSKKVQNSADLHPSLFEFKGEE